MFWMREVVGWVLIGLGLFVFAFVYFGLLRFGHIARSVPLTFIGFIVFRGGIHLVKVAVAARICQELAEQPKPKPTRPEGARRPVPGQRTAPPPIPVRPLNGAEPAGRQ